MDPPCPVHPSIHCFKEHFRYHHRHTGQNSIGDGDSIWPKTIEEKQKLSRILPTRSLSPREDGICAHAALADHQYPVVELPKLWILWCFCVVAWHGNLCYDGRPTNGCSRMRADCFRRWCSNDSISKLVNRERWRHARKLENDTSVYFIISMLGWAENDSERPCELVWFGVKAGG